MFFTTPKQELQLRWKKIQAKMSENNIDACLISTNVNLLYTLGQIINGYVYLRQEGDALVFIRRPQGIENENCFYIRKPEQITEILAEMNVNTGKTLLFESGEIPHTEWIRYEKIFRPENIVDGTPLLRKIRSVKTDYELALMTESARLQSLSYTQIPSLYRLGITEHEFAVAIECNARLNGNLGIFRIFGQSMEAFMGSILSGDNAEAPSPYDFALGGAGMHPSLPLGHTGGKFQEGTSVMIDVQGNYTGYISDLTRTYSIGKLPQKAYDAHCVSIEIQQKLAEMGKSGVACEDLYHESLKMAEKYNLSNCYMGTKQQAKFVGHGVGLVVNELPVLCDRNKELLEENMTIALEPKFVFPGIGAVGTENTFIVRENGMEKITNVPEELINLNLFQGNLLA